MDTRFWGPSGWKLLHLITFSKPQNATTICDFFETLAYVLPCKFCRASFSEYILEDPVQTSCRDPVELQKWLWRLHNRVNEKLNAQGLMKKENPTFSAVSRIYKHKLAEGCSRTTFDGWDFLFCVADNHPLSRASRAALPIRDAPPLESLDTPLLRNRWNVMDPEERMVYYEKFWKLLPEVLPFEEWRDAWHPNSVNGWDTQKKSVRTLWAIRCSLEKELNLLNRTTYSNLCKVLQNHRSGCSTSTRGKTCRKKRGNK
jgi:hypothetical protein